MERCAKFGAASLHKELCSFYYTTFEDLLLLSIREIPFQLSHSIKYKVQHSTNAATNRVVEDIG